jgi:threonine/homoserine/homoserine lactone efflux protein
MQNIRFDWRWLVLVGGLIVLAAGSQVPWIIRLLVLAGGGGYLLWIGWQKWTLSGGPPSRSSVTYWRGQRIELEPRRRGPALPRVQDIGPALIYLIIGGLMVLAGAALVLQEFGL